LQIVTCSYLHFVISISSFAVDKSLIVLDVLMIASNL